MLHQISTHELQQDTLSILSQVNQTHQPIVINEKDNDCVLLAKSDWSAICETLYLNSIPGMTRSIQEGLNTSVDNCKENISW